MEFLQELVETPSPAGYEERNLEDWIRRIDEHADEVTTDSYGNTTATLNPGYNRSIVLTGHADEVGLMVRYISDNGFIYVKEIGTPHPGTTRGQRVVLQGTDGSIAGVIGEKPQFLQDEEEPERSPSTRDLYIDIGASDRAQVE